MPRDLTPLTHTETAILDLERSWWKYPGAKDTEIMERFGLTATSYCMALNALIDHPAALEHDPLLVRRLRRLRAARARQRSAVRLSFDAGS